MVHRLGLDYIERERTRGRSVLRVHPFFTCFVFAALACSAGAENDVVPNGGDAGHAGETKGATSVRDAGADSGHALDAASGPMQAEIGPIPVPANAEKTVCIVKTLGNSDDIVVTGMSATLAPGSHHLVVYRTTAPVNLTPTPCSPFAGIGSGTDMPILIATKAETTWAFPSGVGLELKPNQALRIEAHYLNVGATAIEGHGSVSFQGGPVSAAGAFQPADVLVWGTTQISIPAESTWSTGVHFQAGMAGTHMLSLTTHEHRLGSRVQVWTSAAPGSQGELLADAKDWASPAWLVLPTPLDFDGTNGVSYQCDWNNTTNETVNFGESALDEMCFVIGYYYPSTGVDLCLDGTCVYRKRDGG